MKTVTKTGANQMTIKERVRHALESAKNSTRLPWDELMAVYRGDREAFYLLACDGVSEDADQSLRTLSALAQTIRAGAWNLPNRASQLWPGSDFTKRDRRSPRPSHRDGPGD
jgi:hypothetical protein